MGLHLCEIMECQHAMSMGKFTGPHMLQVIYVLQQVSSRTALQGCARSS